MTRNVLYPTVFPPDKPIGISDNYVKAVAEEEDGTLWFGTNKGLNRPAPGAETFIHYFHQPGNPNSPGHNLIRALYAEKGGILRIGTKGAGLTRFDINTGKFRHFKHDPADRLSISDNKIQSIYRDSYGTLWIGTYLGGLNRYNPGDGTFDVFKYAPSDPHSLNHNRVEVLYESRGGILWICTRGGRQTLREPRGDSSHPAWRGP
ncbi:MAG: hypothetical protein GY765_38470 [bacterium]|nr:hypothetical protein [bacterium]